MRLWMRSAKGERNPFQVAEFRITARVANSMITQLNNGIVEKVPDKRQYSVVFPKDAEGKPIWCFMREQNQWFEMWLLGMFARAIDNPNWGTGDWFRVYSE